MTRLAAISRALVSGVSGADLGVRIETSEQAIAARRRLRYASLGLVVAMLLFIVFGIALLYFTQGCAVHVVHGRQVRLC